MGDGTGISFADILSMFMESEHWPHEDMLAFQRSQLEQLLRHARANVPFYKTRLNCMFRGDDSVDWDRWTDIPVLTRKEVQTNIEDLWARNLPPGHGPWKEFATSGTTGYPVRVRVPAITTLVGNAAWKRLYRRHGIADDARFVFIRGLDGSEEQDSSSASTDNTQPRPQMSYLSRHLSPEQKLDFLYRSQPDVLIDIPNPIEILSRKNLRRSQRVSVKHIVAYGASISAEQLALFQESFSATVVSAYSTKEAGVIAGQCPHGDAFHVNEEVAYLEPGFSGAADVIVTPLFQTAQPFIRYQQSDKVHMTRGCTCGFRHLTITQIDGRSEPIFRFPDGRERAAFATGLYKTAFHAFCIAYQVAQVAPLALEVRYVADRPATAEEELSMASALHFELHPDASITFRKVDEIPTNKGGKQLRFAREFDMP